MCINCTRVHKPTQQAECCDLSRSIYYFNSPSVALGIDALRFSSSLQSLLFFHRELIVADAHCTVPLCPCFPSLSLQLPLVFSAHIHFRAVWPHPLFSPEQVKSLQRRFLHASLSKGENGARGGVWGFQ
jgi:hypothetical protein